MAARGVADRRPDADGVPHAAAQRGLVGDARAADLAAARPARRARVGASASRCGSPRRRSARRPTPPASPSPAAASSSSGIPGWACRSRSTARSPQINTLFAENTRGIQGAGARRAGRDAHARQRRGGAITWDYLFPFGGASRPGRAALSQATAIRAYLKANRIGVARQIAALFGVRAPLGIRVPLGADGNWYALYSFAPGQLVLNAAPQRGDRAARPRAREQGPDDGRAGGRGDARGCGGTSSASTCRACGHATSEGGPPADLNYHVLNRDLAGALCRRTGEAAVCKASDSFARELERRCPKAITPQERSAPPSRPASRTS